MNKDIKEYTICSRYLNITIYTNYFKISYFKMIYFKVNYYETTYSKKYISIYYSLIL